MIQYENINLLTNIFDSVVLERPFATLISLGSNHFVLNLIKVN